MVALRYLLETQQPWADKLVTGEKPIETREYPLPPDMIGVPVHIVVRDRVNKMMFHCVGEVTFSRCKQYTSFKEWSSEEVYHLVQYSNPPDQFGWSDSISKYGWVVQTYKKYDACPQLEDTIDCERVVRSIYKLRRSKL